MPETVELSHGRRASLRVVGDGEPLLWFPGGPGMSAEYLVPAAELLADRFRLHLLDPPGSGESTPPEDPIGYHPLGHARFYDDVRRALGLERAVIAGDSFGGTVALTYAATFPEVPTRVLSIAAYALGEEVDADVAAASERAVERHAGADWYPAARATWDGWTERALAATDGREVDAMFAEVAPLYVAHPERPEVRAELDRLLALTRFDLAAVHAWENGLWQGIDLRPVLARIACPTLVLVGELDAACGPAQGRAIANAVTQADLVVLPDCGHFLSAEAPDAFRSAILGWVDQRA